MHTYFPLISNDDNFSHQEIVEPLKNSDIFSPVTTLSKSVCFEIDPFFFDVDRKSSKTSRQTCLTSAE